MFENAVTYPNSETKLISIDDRLMPSPSLMKLVLRTLKNCPLKVPQARRKCAKSSVTQRSVDYLILLKFCTEFKHITPKVP